MRRSLALLVVLLVSSIGAPVGAKEKAGTFERHSYTNEFGTRQYMVYVPGKLKKEAPVVAYLHGCTQTADDAALGTEFNLLAEEQGFIAVYPEQDPAANGRGVGTGSFPSIKPVARASRRSSPASRSM